MQHSVVAMDVARIAGSFALVTPEMRAAAPIDGEGGASGWQITGWTWVGTTPKPAAAAAK